MAIIGASIVLPDRVVEGQALLIEAGRIVGLAAPDALPAGCARHDLDGGWLLPGFIDTQVNGGGDILFNDRPDVAGIGMIAAAHRRSGTTGLLPTVISDYPDVIDAAIAAGEDAIAQAMPGVLGVHVEGPHLNPAKKGIHDQDRLSPISDRLIARLMSPGLGRRIVTLAPELAPPGTIRALNKAGVRVSAGHSMAGYEQTLAALAEGLAGFTHLFNAMVPMTGREPGMVGAALEDRATHFGLIVDGVHVHPATLRIALMARGVEGAMLVTDAMPPVGGKNAHFSLMGTPVSVVDGTCRGPDGTLAGSALSMVDALRNTIDLLGQDMVVASRMASGNPARFLGLGHETGAIAAGLRADLVHLDAAMRVTATWISGLREDHPS